MGTASAYYQFPCMVYYSMRPPRGQDTFLLVSIDILHVSLAGEHQQPHFPGLTRGLVAVLLYWDGKLCVANSLRSLIQSRQGKTFTLELR